MNCLLCLVESEPELDKEKNETSSPRDLQAASEACAGGGGVKSGLVLPDGFAGRGRALGTPTGKLAPAPELLEWSPPPTLALLTRRALLLSPLSFLAPPLCTLTPFGK